MTEELKRKRWPFFFCGLIVVSLLLFYTAYDKKTQALHLSTLAGVLSWHDPAQTLKELNKVTGLAGIGLFGIAMAIGSLAVISPHIFGRYLWWRRTVGLTGGFFVLVHSLYAVAVLYQFSPVKMFIENEKIPGVITGLVSFFLLLAMAAARRRVLPLAGFLALAAGLLHFILMETGKSGLIEIRPYGWVFLYLAFAALLLKLAMMFVEKPER